MTRDEAQAEIWRQQREWLAKSETRQSEIWRQRRQRTINCPAPAEVICVHGRLISAGLFFGHCPHCSNGARRCLKVTGGVNANSD